MNILTVDSLAAAREKLLDCAGAWNSVTETVSLQNACGRVLAVDILSGDNIPSFRRSTVDGYAVVAGDTVGASDTIPVFLTLAGTVEMGKPACGIQSGSCAYVPTGGMLPDGADAVVMVEYSETLGENDVALYAPVSFGTNVVEIGEDVKKGAVLLRKGCKIRPQEAGALAAAGILEVSVYAPFRLTLISTGDELVPPEQAPVNGEIRDINTYALHALAVKSGYRVVASHVLPDDREMIERAVRDALSDSDVIAVSGGSSQGKMDLTAEIVKRVANPGILTHGISIKPGKPTILGWDFDTKTLLAGLPGHPVSAMMVFEMLFSWLVDTLNGTPAPHMISARISCNLASAPGKTTCQPVVLKREGDSYLAVPVFGKSGLITTLTRADGYFVIEMNKEGMKKDEQVLVHLF